MQPTKKYKINQDTFMYPNKAIIKMPYIFVCENMYQSIPYTLYIWIY